MTLGRTKHEQVAFLKKNERIVRRFEMQMLIEPSASIRKRYNRIVELSRKAGLPVFLTKNGAGDLAAIDIAVYFRKESRLELRERLVENEEKRRAGEKDIPAKVVCEKLREIVEKHKLLVLTEENGYPSRGDVYANILTEDWNIGERKEERIDMQVYHGRPENDGDRLPKELAVYDLLDELGIPYDRVDHQPMMTIAQCEEVDAALNIQICKNLFLCNQQKTKFYLLMMPGTKKFVTKEVCKLIPSPRLSFANEIYMEELLNITPGSVSIMGLMNDTENRVQLLIDRDVAESEYLGCHPCINTSSLKLRMKDILEKFLPHVHHDYQILDI